MVQMTASVLARRTVARSRPRWFCRILWVPRSSSTSRDQAVFVDQATDASLSSDAVLPEIDRFG